MNVKDSLKDIIPYSPGKSYPGKIKLSSNENPLGPSPKAVQAITNILQGIHRYPDGASQILRKKIAQLNACKAEEIMVGNGSDELFALICGALVDKGSNGIISDNTFSEYRFSIKLFSGQVQSVPLIEGYYDLNAMAKAVNKDTRIVFLCNPNNPTGTYRNHQDIKNFMASIPKDVAVVMDEAYQDYCDAKDYPKAMELITQYPNLLVTRTFSKIFGLAGLRLGYGLAQEGLIRNMMTAKQAFNVNLLSQAAGAAALDDLSFLKESREMTLRGKQYLYQHLAALKIHYYPTQSNFLCLNLNQPAEDVFQRILDQGIIIRSLKSFGLDHSIRYTISNEEENRLFISILKGLKVEGLC